MEAEIELRSVTGHCRWYLANGDGYALSIKNALWGGTVSGLG